MKLKDVLQKPIKPITASEALEFIKKNKDKFIKKHGIKAFNKLTKEYLDYLDTKDNEKSK